MGWLGSIIGYGVGNAFGGILGGLICAVIGNFIENGAKENKKRYSRSSSNENEALFLAGAAAIMAKFAKADGHISMQEIDSVEKAFKRLGLTKEKRIFCIEIFRKAKDDNHTIYEYADSFAAAQPDMEIREIFYDILWDLAASDGTISQIETDILRRIIHTLRIPAFLFEYEYQRHYAGYQEYGHRDNGRTRTSSSDLLSAYETLGVPQSCSDDELKKAYRLKAKKYHPDELTARGLSPELVKKATEQMARVNAAYDAIKKARGI